MLISDEYLKIVGKTLVLKKQHQAQKLAKLSVNQKNLSKPLIFLSLINLGMLFLSQQRLTDYTEAK
jgi:hypothetical protein